jgi:hypothetical protein
MDPTASIRRLGFRKWYERQLIDCHLALVTCFLSGLTVAALLESINLLEFGWRPVSMLAIMFVAGVTGWLSWRRYITVLERAERYGQRSTCVNCKTYARFEVLSTGMDTMPGEVAAAVAPLEAAWLRVQCRKCGSIWRMPE